MNTINVGADYKTWNQVSLEWNDSTFKLLLTISFSSQFLFHLYRSHHHFPVLPWDQVVLRPFLWPQGSLMPFLFIIPIAIFDAEFRPFFVFHFLPHTPKCLCQLKPCMVNVDFTIMGRYIYSRKNTAVENSQRCERGCKIFNSFILYFLLNFPKFLFYGHILFQILASLSFFFHNSSTANP